MPEAIVIAGANGAGKTTFARELLPALYPDVEFLNVDEAWHFGSAVRKMRISSTSDMPELMRAIKSRRITLSGPDEGHF